VAGVAVGRGGVTVRGGAAAGGGVGGEVGGVTVLEEGEGGEGRAAGRSKEGGWVSGEGAAFCGGAQ